MKSRHFWLSVFAVLLLWFLLSQGYGDADLLMRQGNYYFGQGTYDLGKAESAFKKAVRIEPKILWGHYQLARIYFVKGDFEKALEEINKELEANPENLRSLYVRGLIYGFSSRHALAEEDFQRFVRWAPKEWAGYNDLAWILSSQGKYAEAKEAINNAFKEVPEAEKNPWFWNSLGVAQLNLRENSEAEKSFNRAKELAEKLSLSDFQKAYPGNSLEDAKEGLRSFKEAIKENLRRAAAVDNSG